MIIKDYEVCSPDMCSGGTSLQGYKTTTYDRLRQVLGPPTFTSADPYDKVSCEWVIDAKWYDANNVDEIDYDDWNYETVTIYAWKYGYIEIQFAVRNTIYTRREHTVCAFVRVHSDFEHFGLWSSKTQNGTHI